MNKGEREAAVEKVHGLNNFPVPEPDN